MSEKRSTFFGGAAILAAGTIIVKLIGALYKIPMANILGDTANGYFSSAYSVYSVLLTISTGGLPVALSKQVSEADALGLVNQRKRVFSVALRALFLLGLVSFLIMFFGAGFLTQHVIQNPGAYYATLALAPAALLVCCMSAIRGYAQGMRNMVPTAVSQIIEALCKLILGLSLAYILLVTFTGRDQEELALELAAAGAIAGVTIGTLVALVYLTVDHLRRKKGRSETGTDTPQSSKAILKRLVGLAVPITLGSAVVPIVNFLDAVQVQSRLQSVFQLTSKAASGLYGTYSAATSLYSLPSALMVPFTASLIPAISAARARRDHVGASKVAESAMRVAMLLACPMGFGLCALSTPIVKLLYPSYDAAVMGPILAVLGIASIFTCVVVLSNSVLQASGSVNPPMLTMMAGGILKLIINYVLVGTVGVQGAPWGTLACFGTAAVLDLILIRRTLSAAPNYFRIFFKPLLASGIMALAAWASHGLLFRLLDSNSLATVGAIGIAVVVYAVLVLVLRAISADDLALMPKGDKIGKILRIR